MAVSSSEVGTNLHRWAKGYFVPNRISRPRGYIISISLFRSLRFIFSVGGDPAKARLTWNKYPAGNFLSLLSQKTKIRALVLSFELKSRSKTDVGLTRHNTPHTRTCAINVHRPRGRGQQPPPCSVSPRPRLRP